MELNDIANTRKPQFRRPDEEPAHCKQCTATLPNLLVMGSLMHHLP